MLLSLPLKIFEQQYFLTVLFFSFQYWQTLHFAFRSYSTHFLLAYFLLRPIMKTIPEKNKNVINMQKIIFFFHFSEDIFMAVKSIMWANIISIRAVQYQKCLKYDANRFETYFLLWYTWTYHKTLPHPHPNNSPNPHHHLTILPVTPPSAPTNQSTFNPHLPLNYSITPLYALKFPPIPLNPNPHPDHPPPLLTFSDVSSSSQHNPCADNSY